MVGRARGERFVEARVSSRRGVFRFEASRRRKHRDESGEHDKDHDKKSTMLEESHSSDVAGGHRCARGGDSYEVCVLSEVVPLRLQLRP